MSALQPRQRKKDPRSGTDYTRSGGQSDSSDVSAQNRTDRAADAEGMDYAVAHGVELGYRVIDQYVRQGQRAAERLNPRDEGRGRDSDASAGDLRDDLEELAERLLRFTTSLIPQRTEVEGVLAWGRDFLRGLLSQWAPNLSDDVANDGALPDGDRNPGDSNLSVEVVSSRPIRVTLDLRAHSGRVALMGEGMRAADSGSPPLGDVTFVDADGDDCLVVRIRVADDQPAGTYTGVVTDAQSGEHCGTLSVRVGAA